MKRLSIFLLLGVLLTSLWSCEKEENRVYFEGGTPPALTVNNASPGLRFEDSDKEAIRFNWTNPDFKFNTGISSQDVNYILEMDTAGANFSRPTKASVSVNRELSRSFTVSQFNDVLQNTMLLAAGKEHNLEVRVRASIGNTATAVFSNSISIKATPYALPPKIAPPTTGALYIVGSATPGGWNNPVPVPSQQFTRVSETLYEITLDMVGGGAYLLIPTNGQWAKYNVNDDTIPGIAEGGDFFREGSKDIPGPAAAGTYKITVDFQRGKFTVVKQ
ncbi:SusE domain-containing protein [Flavihumibacter sp. RY-1]|uniref:SusE domain-containing protein n=1 Tax=Flavihumibacter fluminis TaxID=2909236 RepID=A0ABS9BKC3_9BACT|nr:SusE domain-containing protein [Flavihumibacter fluminis]MCF1715795.1 SusE domain-containing protein [Flavihumibacter fluminis]